ncbi:TATA box-binding protein-associated factor RNA polymerase I subunit D isoform X1 [Suricata suricatta]|uniref:TATA box-binding protein-associated factor RNA polymerase I subunit D n=1 Tax=Suricata suricatta TaxID=37032 RepID=A0A673TM64_SURSU|nr:TATA box-binding protein-associated factor RNA polymerase I subunit D isoform X1 [Suricata suricatta]XP_029771180.1 TATA box-binding protein-associated factor RNA polymerase I subunit D isoform X1 [Suricata suricatta]XP_029771181.1 TATA box-binding protein-associated factor RNA polymerase I subunit D isoform X1 [Suricata suricatta]XP_029771182.1 TATA box-binding protein-associated factor RNA polymerase I subunit D isoform X1 [Suricata suricatta]XP_029771183.1 TATA box-binding protein-associa
MDSLNPVMASDSVVEIENHSDNSSSGSSLFKTQCVPSPPKWRQRNAIRKFVYSAESVEARDSSSSDSSLEPRPLTLKAIFERFKKKKRKKRKSKPRGKPRERPKGRPKGRKNTRRSQINRKQVRDKGSGFPFLESKNGRKPLPWRKILTFEQAMARGFFNYLEKLKYEYYLKESLKQMNVSEDLEKEDFDSRRYKYLDDDGSLSPIESEAEDEVAVERDDECDIKLVDHNCFIVSSEVPKKTNVYLEREEYTEEVVLSKKRASRSKNIGQRIECPEKEIGL